LIVNARSSVGFVISRMGDAPSSLELAELWGHFRDAYKFI
jgi:hypothetical protein